MAAVKKQAPPMKKDDKVEKIKSVIKEYPDLELPSEKNVPSNNLSDYTFLITGEEKIGKTTLTAQFGETLIFSFEKGTKSIPVYATDMITEWEMFLTYLQKLEDLPAKKRKYNFYCIDTGHAAYDRCLEYICRRDQISHPGKVNDYGASWKEVIREFTMAHTRLSRLGGFLVISHERTRERKNRHGEKYDRIEPCFSETAENFYKAIIDVVGYYSIFGGKRFLQIQPSEMIHAGHRVDGHFKTSGTHENVFRIPMADSAERGFRNIQKAFNNKQRKTYQEIEESTGAVRKAR